MSMRKEGEFESGIGLGRLGKPELFGEGLYRLFYLSSMKQKFYKAAQNIVEKKEVEPDKTSKREGKKEQTNQEQIIDEDSSENNQ
jgi:hypothetical protein